MGKSSQVMLDYQKRYREEVKAGLRAPQSGPQQKKAADLICPQCSKTFYRPPSNRSPTGVDYCSRACMASAYQGRFVGTKSPRYAERTIQTCDNCGKAVSLEPWKVTQQERQKAEHTFCNRVCFGEWKAKNWCGESNPAWVGGKAHYRGPNWVRQAREARRRDGHCCRECGKSEKDLRRALNVHHILPFRFFGLEKYKEANRLSNLVSLCDNCHSFMEKISKHGKVTDWPTLKDQASQRRINQKPRPQTNPQTVT